MIDRVLEVLRDARYVLRVPDRWTGGKTEARNAAGVECDPTDPAAQEFSVRGAMFRSLVERGFFAAKGRLDRMVVHEACGLLAPRASHLTAQEAVTALELRVRHDRLLEALDRAISQREAGVNPRAVVSVAERPALVAEWIDRVANGRAKAVAS